jgi:hypothetical protein
MKNIPISDLNQTISDDEGNVIEEWSVDELGHAMRTYSAPAGKTPQADEVSAGVESAPISYNRGADFDSSEFPSKVSTPDGEYRRDDAARNVGGQWLSANDKKRLLPVPANVNLSLRRWNGLSSRTREQLNSMMTEMPMEDLKDIGGRSKDEWEEIVSGFTAPQKKLVQYFMKNRPRKEFDPNDIMSFAMELDNLGITDSEQPASTEEDKTMSFPMATRLEAWKASRKKQEMNPSYNLLLAPRLSEAELDEWTDAAAVGVATSLREATEVLELSMNDKLPDNLLDRIARRYLTEQEPPAASFDDFEMAVDMVKHKFGYPISIESMIEDGTIGDKEQDMILSGKLVEMMQIGDLAAVEPKVRKLVFSLMEMLGVRKDVPEQVPNDTASANFRPYISPST